jgi:small subunit ribosomal protein S18
MIRTKKLRARKSSCKYCTKSGCPRPAFVDYKDVASLKKLISPQSKLFSRKRSQLCAPFQRAASAAVKRARIMGLLPYVAE